MTRAAQPRKRSGSRVEPLRAPLFLLPLWEKVARIDRCATDEGSVSADRDPSPRFALRSDPLPQGERVLLRRVGALLPARLEQEPGALLGLVDEELEQLRGATVLVVVGEL